MDDIFIRDFENFVMHKLTFFIAIAVNYSISFYAD